ncbi:DNA replication terminus site-binding protein [Pseudomonas sp. 11/12A]|uniref:DNA replication terminus site-binding protein n=1 Tax=Pseudomonas sp. 11/12A TaxID=1506582 RepID=UPI0009E01044|nr:DNA replication terminus site-binding protein [Pseudomonas sp. 11/12A]
MMADIVHLHACLNATLKEFGNAWPNFVVRSKVWQLPLLAEQKAADHIEARALEGCAAIDAAIQAMSMFERMPDQAPGTVMRLPGYFALSESVLHWVKEINQLKDQLMMAIERTRIEMNLAPSARSKILRLALGGQMSMKQLLRHIQAFDICPRLIVFTWAGHTTGGERVAVGKVRELLGKTAKQQAMKEGVEVDQTLAGAELRRIINLADQASLIKYKKVAPHPRAMVYFSDNSRYDAMTHSNLPMFVLAGDHPSDIHELRDFNRHTRQAQRPDKKTRIEVIPRMNLYLNPDDLVGQRKAEVQISKPSSVSSTYAAGSQRKKIIETPDTPQLDLNFSLLDD